MNRRSFLALTPVVLAPAIVRWRDAPIRTAAALSASYPTQDADLIKEMVGASHFNVARVKELVTRQPSLARAAWDWGFGDWEEALGAASHVGNREIAALLLAHGARPSIFSAAMLGQLDVVKGFITGSPGIQKIKGPHSITLLKHAIAGGANAKPVVEYLKSVGGADETPEEPPLTAEQLNSLAGSYEFGSGADERLDITVLKDRLNIARPAHTARVLMHLGSLEFYPAGSDFVRIVFKATAGGMTLTVRDPDVVLVAIKRA